MWLCAAFEGSPTLVHARSGFRLSFHHGIQARQLVVLSDIHYFDAHRLHPSLAAHLDTPVERRSQAVATEEGHEAASVSATDIEDSTSDVASTVASDPAYPTVAWCPPIPDAVDDPTEQEIASAADQLDILISQPKTAVNPFCNPANLGCCHICGCRLGCNSPYRPSKKNLAASWSALQVNCGYEAKVRPLKRYCLE